MTASPMARLAVTGLVVARDGATPAAARRILDGVDLVLEPGAVVAVTGPSGAGKTTLLHAIAGLLVPSAGSVRWGDLDVGALTEARRDRWRRDTVGLVFQDFQLVPELGVLDNILMPLHCDHWRVPPARRAEARALAARVGLDDPARRAAVLSRGEQQRAAIARALVRRPALLVADEPTASLDAVNGAAAADLLIGAARADAASLLIVSHDRALLDRADRVYHLEAGRLSQAGGAAA